MRDAMVRAVSDKHMVVQLLAILRTMTAPLSTPPREGQSGERDRDNGRSDGMFHRNLMTLRRMTSLYVSNPVTETVLLRPVQRAVEDIIEQLIVFRTLAAEVQNAALKEELDLSLSKEVDERIAMLEQSMRTAFAT